MKREATYDIMKGAAILTVLIGHTEGLNIWEQNFIYSFHMPLFFILAGYFYKDKGVSYIGILRKDFKRLIVPYLSTCTLLLAYMVLYAYKKHDSQLFYNQILATIWAAGYYHHSPIFGHIRYIGPIWFLASLFWCKLSFVVLRRNVQKRFLLPMAIIISVGTILLDYYVINLPLGLLPGLSVLLFYTVGFLLKEYIIPKWLIWTLVFCWPIAIWYGADIKVFSQNPWICVCTYACWPLDVAGALGGVLVIRLLSEQIEKRTHHISELLAWCGRLSLPILCFHVLELNTAFFAIFFQAIHIETGFMLVIICRICFAIVLTVISMKLSVCRKIFQM